MVIAACLLAEVAGIPAVEHVTFLRDGRQIHASGKLEIEAVDGGLLLLADDGLMHAIQPDEIVKRSQDDVPFAPLSAEAMGQQMLASLPDGFHVHNTAHYLICYDTSKAYADWCGALFERLYRGFTNFWSRKGFALHEPEFPLVAVVFADRSAYLKYAKAELGRQCRRDHCLLQPAKQSNRDVRPDGRRVSPSSQWRTYHGSTDQSYVGATRCRGHGGYHRA